jgi:glycerol kinase
MSAAVDEPLILAIDQGTSGSKAILFDAQGGVHARGFAALDCSHPREGFVEQDPAAILHSVKGAVAGCLAGYAGDPAAIAGIGISNQRETALLWDRQGRPLAPAVSWQCQRSLDICRRLREEGLDELVGARTGLLIDPYFSASKLIWLNENVPGVRNAIAAGQAHFGTVDSWLLHALGGAYLTDVTNASRTMLFDYRALAWDETLIERFGLSGLRLPEVRPSASVFATSDLDGLLPRALPIVAMIGDSHAAAVGEGCLRPGVAKATVGTGSSIMMNAGPRPVEAGEGLVSTLGFATAERVDYALEGIIVSAGATASWLKDKLRAFSDFDEAEAAFASVGNGGVYLVPAFSGLGCPHWKHGGGQLVGLSLASDWRHVVRAGYESIAYQIRDVVDAMERANGVPLSQLYLDGGLVRRPFLLQFLADVLRRPVSTLASTDISAAGAARLAFHQLGLAPLERSMRLARTQHVEPGAGAEAAQEAHAQWLRWIARL